MTGLSTLSLAGLELRRFFRRDGTGFLLGGRQGNVGDGIVRTIFFAARDHGRNIESMRLAVRARFGLGRGFAEKAFGDFAGFAIASVDEKRHDDPVGFPAFSPLRAMNGKPGARRTKFA